MDTKNVSLRIVLNQVISRFGLREVLDLPLYDMFAWMGEALRHIGGYTSLEITKKEITIVNHIGKFPEDLHAIIRVEGHSNFKSIRGGFIVPLEEGSVIIEYDRYPLDEEGIPLIPNDPSTRDAIMWYVAWFLAIQDKIPNPRITVQYCEVKWQWYCGQARAEGYAPTIDQWERMVNTFYRLIPLNNEYENEFKGIESREDLVRGNTNSHGTIFR